MRMHEHNRTEEGIVRDLLSVGCINNLLKVLLQNRRPRVLDLARLEIGSSSLVLGDD
jgi:hypothetical protein